MDIEVGSIVSIGKAKTLWEVTRLDHNDCASLVKVDGDGYVNLTRPLADLNHQCPPCQEVTLHQLIAAKEQARQAALDLADRLRLWPAEDEAWAAHRAATRALEAWTAARDAHYSGRRAGNIECAIREAKKAAA
jgi:hypothetical protein